MTRFIRQALCLASLTLALLAPAVAVAAPKSLTVAIPGDFPSMNPSKDSSLLGLNYRLNVYDQLTEIQRDGGIKPRLATEWSASNDLTVWTFKIRQGVTFHDGTPLTAEDVHWTIRLILDDSASPTRIFLRLVDDVEFVDDRTVRFKLKQPYSIFHRQISFISIMSKAYYQKVGEKGYAAAPIGSGPYKFVEWVKDDRLVLQANKNYWGGAPKIENATFRPIVAEASRAASLISGDVDFVPSLPPALIDRVKSASRLKGGIAPGFRVVFVAFNANVPPLDNDKIRAAIDHAINREAIASQLLRGLGIPAGMMLPPNNFGFDPALKPVAFDPEKAAQLVKESGYSGKPISIQFPNNNFVMANEVAQAVAGYLTAVGLKVELKPMEFTAFFPAWVQKKMESMYLFAYGSSQYHGDTILTSMYEAGANNYKVNPEIDKLVKLQRTIADPEEQKRIISKALELSNEDRLELPLYNEMQAFGIKADIDYTPWPDSFVRLYDFK